MNTPYFIDFLNQWKTLPLENGLPNIISLEKINFGSLEKNIFVMKKATDDYFPISRSTEQLKDIYHVDMFGVNFLDLFKGDDLEKVRRNINNILAHKCGGLIWSLSLQPSGEDKHVRTYGLPFKDKKGKINQIVCYTEVVDVIEEPDEEKPEIEEPLWPLKDIKHFDIGHGVPPLKDSMIPLQKV
jgi:hypothetical protein